MITLTTIPYVVTRVSAYGDNLVIAETNDPDVVVIKYELSHGGNNIMKQYSPVRGGEADFHMRSVYRAMLDYYNNPLDSPLGAVSYDEMRKQITETYTEIINPVTEETGHSVSVNKTLLKRAEQRPGFSFANNDTKPNEIIRHCFSGQKIPFTVSNTHPSIIYELMVHVDGSDIQLNIDSVPGDNLMMGVIQATWDSDQAELFLQEKNTPGSTGGNTMKLFIDHKCYSRSKTIYWLNRYGGWDWFNAIDYEVITKTEKEHLERYVNKGREREPLEMVGDLKKEYILFGKPVIWEYINHYDDLVSASVIFDEDGNKIRLLNTNFDLVRDGLMEPQIRIEYMKERVVNY